MTLLIRSITCLAVAAFLLSGTLLGHHGHHDLGGSQSSGHGMALAKTPFADDPHHGDQGQGDLEKASCDFAHVSSCGAGHCCFPMPMVELARADLNAPEYWSVAPASAGRAALSLEPPPPKLA